MAILREKQVWQRHPEGRRRPRDITGRLTPGQCRNVRAALRVLRGRYGGWQALADRLGMKEKVLRSVGCRQRQPQLGHAFRAAQLAGVTIDDVLCGRFPSPDTCLVCGR